MSFREYENLKKRGKSFLELAKYSLSRGFYELAVFNSHQAAELFTKGVLLKVVGTYPRTHDLLELLEWLSERCDRMAQLLAEKGDRIEHLTDAYFSSRYGEREFRETLARSFVRLVEEVLTVESLCEED